MHHSAKCVPFPACAGRASIEGLSLGQPRVQAGDETQEKQEMLCKRSCITLSASARPRVKIEQ